MSSELKLPISGTEASEPIGVALASIRKHLGMEVAYLSEFVDDQSVFREVDAPGLEDMIKPGDSQPLSNVYCRHILEGRLPELMADTADYPLAVAMPITRAAPIGAHMSVPVRLPDGETYGMFCCFSPTPNPSLNARDLSVMRVFAEMVAAQIAQRKQTERATQAALARVEQAIANTEFAILLQPIWEYGCDRPLGFEALSRFRQEPYRTPDVWFNEAAEIGWGVRLEIAVMAEALKCLSSLPDDVYLSLNASPATLLSPELTALLAPFPAGRLVLEITEHCMIDDYVSLNAAFAPLRAQGVRLAVDDAGAGFASFQHILRLQPDIIKMDIALTRAVDTDLPRQSLTSAMVLFAERTQALVIAEGVESEAEWAALQTFGVHRGQGFFLGRPGDLETARGLSLLRRKKGSENISA